MVMLKVHRKHFSHARGIQSPILIGAKCAAHAAVGNTASLAGQIFVDRPSIILDPTH